MKNLILFLSFFICSHLLSAQINGTKTIGGTSPDYSTISSAIDDLMISGINGDITFNIRDGLYETESIIGSFPGSDIYEVIFQSESQDTSAVKIVPVPSGASKMFHLEGANNITFQYLTFEAVFSNTQNVFLLSQEISNIKWLHNHFKTELNFGPSLLSKPRQKQI